jgi:uncharacterized protein
MSGVRFKFLWLTLVPLLAVPLFVLAGHTGPSFDCTKVTDKADQVICDDEDLANDDKEMAEAYHKLRALLSPEAAALLTLNQREWINERDTRCVADVSDCEEAYRQRLSELQDFSGNPSLVVSYLSMHDQFTKAISTGTVPCWIVSHKMAGKDHQGNNVWILQTPGADESHGNFWMLFVQSGKVVRKQYLANLLTIMDNGVDVASGIITIHESVGAMTGHLRSLTASLDTFMPIDQDRRNRWQGDPGTGEWKWNWQQFSGQGEWCCGRGHFLMLPQLPGDSGFWDKIPLGDCSLTLDANRGRWGDPDPKATTDPTLKVLIVGKDLILNVYGLPDQSAASATGVFEITTDNSSDDPQPLGMTVRVAEGHVIKSSMPGKQNVSMINFKNTEGRLLRSFRVTIPTLSDHDSLQRQTLQIIYGLDDGKGGIQRVLSSSQVLDSESVVFPIDPKFATCVPENGALTVKRATEFDENEPVF